MISPSPLKKLNIVNHLILPSCSALSWCPVGWVTVAFQPLLLLLLDPIHHIKNQTAKLPGAFVRGPGCKLQSRERESLSSNYPVFS